MRRINALLTAAAIAFAPVAAVAATFNITFYEIETLGSPETWDADGDGLADGTGTFTAPTIAYSNPVTSASISVAGRIWNVINPAFGFDFFPSFFDTPVASGFVFAPGETPTTNTGALQLFSFAVIPQGAPPIVRGIWAISPCGELACGGSSTRGLYVIKPGNSPVPLPASGVLLVFAAGALGLTAWRKHAKTSLQDDLA